MERFKFYLHEDTEHISQDDDYFLIQKLLNNSLNDQLMNSSLRRSSMKPDTFNKSVDNIIINDNNEKRFFISFDNDSKDKSFQEYKSLTQQPDAVGFVIGHDLVSPDPKTEFAKAKKKEFILNQSLKRKAEQEEKLRILKEELKKKSEEDRKKLEYSAKKKEERRLKREAFLKERKKEEEMEKGGTLNKLDCSKSGTLRNKQNSNSLNKSRPKTIHVSSNFSSNQDQNDLNSSNLASFDFKNNSKNLVSDHLDAASLAFRSSVNSDFSKTFNFSSLKPQSLLSANSAATKHNLPLPPFMLAKNKLAKGSGSSDGVSEIGSIYSEYNGPKLHVKPTQKSNKSIILNAIKVVLGGEVNAQTKKKVLEEINNNDSKNFIILFRGSGMQFRAIYKYNPDGEKVVKMHGTGPKTINNDMIDKFYKFDSGAKNFNEVYTRHLTVTIDAVTIHNHLWNGKKLPVKKTAP